MQAGRSRRGPRCGCTCSRHGAQMAAEMSAAEREAFLDELPARTAVLAVTRKDGRPIGAPIWYVRDGDELVFTTWAESLKGKALRRDPRIALTIEDPAAAVLLRHRRRRGALVGEHRRPAALGHGHR